MFVAMDVIHLHPKGGWFSDIAQWPGAIGFAGVSAVTIFDLRMKS
jgi:hypothetical protein